MSFTPICSELPSETFTTKYVPPTNKVWGKVIFSQASVILSTGWGLGFPAFITGHMTRGSCIQGGLPPGGVCLWGVCIQGGWADPQVCLQRRRLDKYPFWMQTPLRYMYTMGYGQQASGTQPTGMHPCSYCSTAKLKMDYSLDKERRVSFSSRFNVS